MKLNCVKPNYTKRFSGAALFICFYNALPTPPIALRPTNYAFIRYANISSYSYVQLRVLPPRWPLSLRVCVKVVCPGETFPGGMYRKRIEAGGQGRGGRRGGREVG